ncbi:MAG: FlgB family protein [Pseudomonadota bacterium]
MFQNLEIFQMSSAMARHAGARQALISENIANSDTPGYKSKDLNNFKEFFSGDLSGMQKATRDSHLHGSILSRHSPEIIQIRGSNSPNGNSVSIEGEMLKAAETNKQHDRSLAIYKSAMKILRFSLGKV